MCRKFLLILIAAIPVIAGAGTLEPAGFFPDQTNGAMFTINDLYSRLASGTNSPKRGSGFAEPVSGPTNGTTRTLNEVLSLMPGRLPDSSAATAADVPSGLQFWGLSAGEWGLRSGASAYDDRQGPRGEYVSNLVASSISTLGGDEGTLEGVFSADTATSVVVLLKGIPATVTEVGASHVTFTFPPGTGQGLCELFLNGQNVPYAQYSGSSPVVYAPTSGAPFHYNAPVVTAASGCMNDGTKTIACSTAGGVTLLLWGSEFGTNAANIRVFVGGQECGDVVSIDPSELQCTLPARPQGGYDLGVQVAVAGVTGQPAALVSYAGPFLAWSDTLTDLSPTGGTTIVLTGVNLQGGTTTVKYSLAGTSFEDKAYTATVVSVSDSSVECVTVPGIGLNLVFQVKVDQLTSSESMGTISYEVPTIMAMTLREPGGSGSSMLAGTRTWGQEVWFDVVNLASNVAPNLRVFMGPSGGTCNVECAQVKVLDLGHTVSCVTPPGTGRHYVFQLRFDNGSSVAGTDEYSYPDAPLIRTISGCVNVSSNTCDCPTAGGTEITIVGSNFTGDSAVLIGGVYAPLVNSSSPTSITCRLPSGAGTNLPVVVFGPYGPSPATEGLSYARPSVSSVHGCTDVGPTTMGCPTNGGIGLVISGSNFGPSGAQVLVGGRLSTNVAHDASTPNELLHATLPAGRYWESPVVVLNAAAIPSTNVITISYGAGAP